MVLAILFLDESWQLAIILGTASTIVGSAVISWERGPTTRKLGVALALATAVTFAVRDVVARRFNTTSDVSAWWTGAIVLGAATIVLWSMCLLWQRGAIASGVRAALPEFLASGLMIGLALPSVLAALDRGRVGTVAPLSLAVQNLTAVALGAAVFGAHERSARVLVALVAIAAGATLVSVA